MVTFDELLAVAKAYQDEADWSSDNQSINAEGPGWGCYEKEYMQANMIVGNRCKALASAAWRIKRFVNSNSAMPSRAVSDVVAAALLEVHV